MILNEGEKVVVENGTFNKIKNPSLNDLSWKTGKFDFVNTPLPQVAILLNSFYAAQIDFAFDSSLTFTGKFNNDTLSDVLSSLSDTYRLNVEEVDKNKYYILTSK